MNNPTCSLAIATVALGSLVLSARAQDTYDLTVDWVDGSNPNGAWRYVRLATQETLVDYYPDWNVDRTQWSAIQPAFATALSNEGGDGGRPVFLKSNGSAIPSIDLPLGTVGIYGASGNVAEGIIWIAPKDGEISISGSLWTARGTGFVFEIEKQTPLPTPVPIVTSTVVHGGSSGSRHELSGLVGSPEVLRDITVSAGNRIRFRFAGREPNSPEDDIIGVDLKIAYKAIVLSIRCSQVEVCWDTEAGVNYQLQYQSNVAANEWITAMECIEGNGGRLCVEDSIPEGEPERFYRVIESDCVASP